MKKEKVSQDIQPEETGTDPLITASDFITGLALKDMREISAAFISKYDGAKTSAQWQELFTAFVK